MTLLLLASASQARAAERPTLRFSWDRGDDARSCIDEEALRAAITERLGVNPFSADARGLVRGAVSREPTGYRASFSIADEEGSLLGSREMTSTGEDCAGLGRALVLALALALDEALALSQVSPQTAPSDETHPQTTRLEGVTLYPQVVRQASFAPRVSAVDVGALVQTGLLPRSSVGVGFFASVAAARGWELVVGGLGYGESKTTADAYGFNLSSGALRGCRVTLEHAVGHVDLCAGLFAGILHVTSHVDHPRQIGDRLFISAAPELQWHGTIIGMLESFASVEAMVPLQRDVFLGSDGVTPVFRQSAVSGQLTVGLGLSMR